MKKLINILIYFIFIIIGVLAVAMMVIEGRLLLSGDFMIYDSPFDGFLRYFLRLIISSSYLFMVLCELVEKIRNSKFISENLLFVEILLFIVSIIILIFSTNFIGIISFVLMSLFIALKILKAKLYGNTI